MTRHLIPLASLILSPFAVHGGIDLKVTENGFGWQQRVSDPQNADPIIDLTDGSVDWMLPHNSDAFDGFNFFARKDGAPLLQFLGTSGDFFTVGANTFDAMQVYFTATDAALDDGFVLGELGIYFGVSWLGSNDGSGTFSWRMTVDTGSFLLFHWWNHGSGFQRQTFRAGLFSADGVLRDSQEFEHVGESFATYLSEVLVTGSAPGDFLIIEQQGHNAGWRGTMVVSMGEGGPVPGDWVEHATLGDLFFFGANWWYSPAVGILYHERDSGWFFQVNKGWLSMPAGGRSLLAEEGAFLYSGSSQDWIWLSAQHLPLYYDFSEGRWLSLE